MLQGNRWDSISERKPRAVDIGEGKPRAVYTDSRENLLVLGSITTWSYASSLLSVSLEDTNLLENSNWGCFWNNWSWRLSGGLLFWVLSKMNLRMRKTCWKVHLLRRQQKFLDRESLNLVLAELSFFFFSDHHSDVTLFSAEYYLHFKVLLEDYLEETCRAVMPQHLGLIVLNILFIFYINVNLFELLPRPLI